MIETVFAVLAPILALGLIGFIATRAGYFQPSHREGLTKYVFDVAVPMLLFSAIVELKPPKHPLQIFSSATTAHSGQSLSSRSSSHGGFSIAH